MSIDNIVKGYKIIKEVKAGAYIPTVEARFLALYRVKHFNELLKMAEDSKHLGEYFEKRDKTFERYCRLNYGKRTPKLVLISNDEDKGLFSYPHNNR